MTQSMVSVAQKISEKQRLQHKYTFHAANTLFSLIYFFTFIIQFDVGWWGVGGVNWFESSRFIPNLEMRLKHKEVRTILSG